MNTIAAVTLLATTCSMLCAGEAGSPFDLKWSVKPALMHSSHEDTYAPAVKWDGSLGYDYHPNDLWKAGDLTLIPSAFAALRSKGAVAWDSRANSENLFAELVGGAAIHPMELQKAETWTGDARSYTNGPGKPDVDFGRLDLGVKVRFETDQPFENYNLTYGPELGYALPTDRGWAALVPSFFLNYQRVDVLHSVFLDKNGVSERSFWRLGVEASWKWRPFTEFLPDNKYTSPIGLHADLRYFQSYDLPKGAAAVNQDEAFYAAGTVSYELTDISSWKYLHNIYVTVAHGRLPPAPKDATMVWVGFVLGGK